MTSPSTRRLPLVLSTAALVIALAGTGGPVLARAFDANNADRVDGKHAVGAAAPVAKRKGKLVAAGKNGYLPNNAIKRAQNADKVDGIDSPELVLPSVVPSGRTVYGRYGVSGVGDGTGAWGGSVSFPVPLPSALDFDYTTGEPTPQCPGSYQSPSAEPGWLCLYEESREGLAAGLPSVGVNKYGFHFAFTDSGAGDVYATGTWAATAP